MLDLGQDRAGHEVIAVNVVAQELVPNNVVCQEEQTGAREEEQIGARVQSKTSKRRVDSGDIMQVRLGQKIIL